MSTLGVLISAEAAMTNLAIAIDEARRHAFVGRSAELARFDKIIRCQAPARVLFVHGPGGIGKTALLDQFRMPGEPPAGRQCPSTLGMSTAPLMG